MARLVTVSVFALAAALVAVAALMVFGPPVKESRGYLSVLVLVPAGAAALASLLAAGGGEAYRMGLIRGALVGLASLLAFCATMAGLGCSSGNWIECLLKALALFGFVMGVPVVVVSALVGMLLEELYCP
jgi:hypothetical protein